jgi:hypothetical protein
MALDKAALAAEVARLSPEFARPTRLDVIAALSLQGNGGTAASSSSGDVSAGINTSPDIETIKETLIAILAELVSFKALATAPAWDPVATFNDAAS